MSKKQYRDMIRIIGIIEDYQRRYFGKNNRVYEQYVNSTSTSSIQQNSTGSYAEVPDPKWFDGDQTKFEDW